MMRRPKGGCGCPKRARDILQAVKDNPPPEDAARLLRRVVDPIKRHFEKTAAKYDTEIEETGHGNAR